MEPLEESTAVQADGPRRITRIDRTLELYGIDPDHGQVDPQKVALRGYPAADPASERVQGVREPVPGRSALAFRPQAGEQPFSPHAFLSGGGEQREEREGIRLSRAADEVAGRVSQGRSAEKLQTVHRRRAVPVGRRCLADSPRINRG